MHTSPGRSPRVGWRTVKGNPWHNRGDDRQDAVKILSPGEQSRQSRDGRAIPVAATVPVDASEKPEKIVQWWVAANNDAIATSVKLAPTRYRGVAGLPQCAGMPISNTFEEIDRCMEMGFVGIMINPDPYEGGGTPRRPG